MAWMEELQRASFRGVEFDVLDVIDAVQRRVVDHSYPYRDGANLEDLGRAPRPTSFRAVFFGPTASNDLAAFLAVADEGATGRLVHPLYGSWQAKVTLINIGASSGRRDYYAVDLEFLEDGTDAQARAAKSVEGAKKALSAYAGNAQAEMDMLGMVNPAVLAAIDDAMAFIDDVESQIDNLSVRLAQLEAAIAHAEASVDAASDVSRWPIVRSLRQLAYSARQLKERIEFLYPRIVIYETPSDTTSAAVALLLYGDIDREPEILRLNKVRDPFLIEAGTRLRVYEK